MLEGTPAHINLAAIEEAMLQVKEVEAVHDLHVWTITSGMEALSVHVVLREDRQPRSAAGVLEAISVLLKEQFGIDHSTIQIEHSSRQEKEMGHR